MKLTADKYILIFLAILIAVTIIYYFLRILFNKLLQILHIYINKSDNRLHAGGASISNDLFEDIAVKKENRSRDWNEKRENDRRSEERRIFNRGFFVRKGFFDEGFSDKLEKEDEFYDRREKNTDKSERRKYERRRS